MFKLIFGSIAKGSKQPINHIRIKTRHFLQGPTVAVIKSGYLQYYDNGPINTKGRKHRYFVLYENSGLLWYTNQYSYRYNKQHVGGVKLKLVANYLSAGPVCRHIPGLPGLPEGKSVDLVMAIPNMFKKGTKQRDVTLNWVLFKNKQEMRNWMDVITTTLPTAPKRHHRKHVDKNKTRQEEQNHVDYFIIYNMGGEEGTINYQPNSTNSTDSTNDNQPSSTNSTDCTNDNQPSSTNSTDSTNYNQPSSTTSSTDSKTYNQQSSTTSSEDSWNYGRAWEINNTKSDSKHDMSIDLNNIPNNKYASDTFGYGDDDIDDFEAGDNGADGDFGDSGVDFDDNGGDFGDSGSDSDGDSSGDGGGCGGGCDD